MARQRHTVVSLAIVELVLEQILTRCSTGRYISSLSLLELIDHTLTSLLLPSSS